MENFLKRKYAVGAILLLIMIAAFAVRFYNHKEWLYFKMDQARDAALISQSVEHGAQFLPLLGPRAGATDVGGGFLRLGPAYYYFQYLSGLIFNSTAPQVFAYPDLFFGIAVLPLLYVFCRIYFKKYISLLVVLMYAFSYLIIEYSRFAWNPNPLPFFTILSFLALLKFLNAENAKSRALWVTLWSFGLAIGSQLHFVGFFSLVGTSGLLIIIHYKIWRKDVMRNIFKSFILKNIALYASLALAVFAFIYTPVIISDVMRGGENTRNFIAAFSGKAKDKPLSEKFARNISEQIEHYTLITTSYVYPKKIKIQDSLPILFTLVIFIAGIYLTARNARKISDQSKKDFLTLLLLWFGVFFILCIPLSFQIRPRFFIFTFAIPFLFLGLVFEFLEEKRIKYYPYIIAGLTTIVFLLNAFGTKSWFSEQNDSQNGDVPIRRTLILKNKDGVTLEQLQKAADFMYEKRKDGSTLYFYTKPEHVSPVKYILSQKKDPNLTYLTLSLDENPNAQYFAVIPSHQDPMEALQSKFETDVEISSSLNCGQISVYEISFPKRTVSKEFRYNKTYSPTDRVFWRDVFGKETDALGIEGDNDSMEDIDMNE